MSNSFSKLPDFNPPHIHHHHPHLNSIPAFSPPPNPSFSQPPLTPQPIIHHHHHHHGKGKGKHHHHHVHHHLIAPPLQLLKPFSNGESSEIVVQASMYCYKTHNKQFNKVITDYLSFKHHALGPVAMVETLHCHVCLL